MAAQHIITHLPHPNSDAREQWLNTKAGIGARLMGRMEHGRPEDMILLANSLSHGLFRLEANDLRGEEGNVLLALLSGRHPHPTLRDTRHDKMTTPPEGLVALAMALVDAGCDPLQRGSDAFKRTDALDLALGHNCTALLEAWLPGVDWERRILEGLPWLHYAAQAVLHDSLGLLLDMGGDIDQRDDEGNTPLFHAHDADTVRMLRKRGAQRDARNTQGLDAPAYWLAGSGLRGSQLTQMTGALGQLAAPKDSATALTQFLELCQVATATNLERNITKLSILGSERSPEGEGILGTAVKRLLPLLERSFGGQERKQARKWLVRVSQWPEAMGAASVEELGMLLMTERLDRVYLGGDPGDTSGAQMELAASSQLAARGVDRERAMALGAVAVAQQARQLNSLNVTAILEALVAAPELMSERADTLIKLLNASTVNWSQAPETTGRIARRITEETEGAWETPGLLAAMLFCGTGKSDKPEQQEACLAMLEAARYAADQGAGWDATCEALAGSAAEDRWFEATAILSGIKAVRATAEAWGLDRGTAPAAGRGARGPRL